MGVLEAFLTTWSQARATFGEGVPRGGAGLDNSTRLQAAQNEVTAAAPSSGWTGAAADSYAERNQRQASTLGAMAGLERRLAAEVDRSAAVVAAGRNHLEAIRQWVVDAAATVPRTALGERMLLPIVNKGIGEVVQTVRRSTNDLGEIARRMREIAYEYRELGRQEKDGDAEALDFVTDDDDADDDIPETTLDLRDIVYLEPGELGRQGMMELVPGSGVWVPDPYSRFYRPTPVEAPLDLNDIEYRGPGSLGQPWEMELIPGSGVWVPDPNHPGYKPSTPEAPVDLAELEFVDPNALVPADMIELWPHSGIIMPNPYLGRPR